MYKKKGNTHKVKPQTVSCGCCMILTSSRIGTCGAAFLHKYLAIAVVFCFFSPLHIRHVQHDKSPSSLNTDLCRSRCARELILIWNGRANLPWFTPKWSLFITQSEVVVSQVLLSAALTSLLFLESGSWKKVYIIIKLKELWPSKGQGGSHLASPPVYLNITDF